MKLKFVSVALAALVASTAPAQAVITVYTSLAAFTAATTAQGTDNYTGFSITGTTPTPVIRSTQTGTSYTYTANATPTGLFFGAGTTANPWLSTNTATDTITFNTFVGGSNGVGGNFFGSNISGLFAPGDLTLTATDASGTVTRTITGATMSSFLGFISDGPITQLTLASVQPSTGGFLWPSVDNLVLAAAVPEPGTYAMMLAGLGVCGFMARRRRG